MMVGLEILNLIKDCCDRCEVCGCYKLPKVLYIKCKEDKVSIKLKCSNTFCDLVGEGDSIYNAIFDWNIKHRKKLKNENLSSINKRK